MPVRTSRSIRGLRRGLQLLSSKTYGDPDPNPLTTGSGDFLAGDNVTATYSRAAGESVAGDPYHITATLNAAAGVLANYTITNTGADFTINTRPATWTTAAPARPTAIPILIR